MAEFDPEFGEEDFLQEIRAMFDERERERAAEFEAEFPDEVATPPLDDADATVIYRPRERVEAPEPAVPDFELPADFLDDVPEFGEEEPMPQRTQPEPRQGAQPIKAYNRDYVKPSHNEKRRDMEDTQYLHQRRPAPSQPEYEADYDTEEYDAYDAPPRRKKRHGILRFFVTLLLILALLAAGFWFLFPKRPDGPAAKQGDAATVLIAGTDRDGYRTDTMMLLYINRDTKALNLLSIPRDTRAVVNGTDMKLNAVYGYGGCGEDGMALLMEEMEDVIGFVPDGYLLLDFDGLAAVINAMGGIEFDVPCDMYYSDPAQDLLIDLSQGLQTLDGEDAVRVLRYRSGYALADLQRVSVQRDMVAAAMEQWISVKNLPRCLRALGMLGKQTTTDLSSRNMVWIAKAVFQLGTGTMQSYTLPGEWSSPYYWLYTGQSADLINTYFNPTGKTITSEDLGG